MSKTNNVCREPTFSVRNTLNVMQSILAMLGATNVDHFKQGTCRMKCCQDQFDAFQFSINDSIADAILTLICNVNTTLAGDAFSASDLVAVLRHCALYEFTYLLTYFVCRLSDWCDHHPVYWDV